MRIGGKTSSRQIELSLRRHGEQGYARGKYTRKLRQQRKVVANSSFTVPSCVNLAGKAFLIPLQASGKSLSEEAFFYFSAKTLRRYTLNKPFMAFSSSPLPGLCVLSFEIWRERSGWPYTAAVT